jgi:phage-related protein
MQAISQIIKDNGPQLRQIFENLGTVIANLAKIAIPLLEFAFTKVLPVAIKILIPILELVTGALAKISTVTRVVANVFEAVMIPAMNLVIVAGTRVVTFITKTLVAAFGAVSEPVKSMAGLLRSVLSPAFDAVRTAAGGVQDIFQWFAANAGPIWAKLARVLPVAVAAITAPFRELWAVITGIVNAMKAFLDKAEEVIAVAGKVGSVVGGILGHIPGRAAGGPVSKGQAYVVGESGPELFVPGMNGSIVPNTTSPSRATSTAGAIGGINVNIYGDVTGDEVVRKVREGLLRVDLFNPGSAIARS